MGDKEVLPKLRIVYQRAPGFRVVPVSGASGGLTGQGLVYVAFYHEEMPGPEVVIRDQETQQEVPEKEMGSQIPMDRTQEFAVMMTPEVADAISKWLSQRAKQAKQALQKRVAAERTEARGTDER